MAEPTKIIARCRKAGDDIDFRFYTEDGAPVMGRYWDAGQRKYVGDVVHLGQISSGMGWAKIDAHTHFTHELSELFPGGYTIEMEMETDSVPAPDENGRIPMLNWEGDSNVSTASFWGSTFKVTQLKDSDYSAQVLGYGKCHLGYFGVIGDAKDRCEDYFAKMFSSILKLPDTRAPAPSAGKYTQEEINDANRSAIAAQQKALKLMDGNKILKDALEEIRKICKGVDEHPDYTFADDDAKLLQGICDKALSAYKGKEGGA